MNMPAPRFELRVEKVVAGGQGLGRHEGQVVFVPRAAPGDRVLVEPVEARRDYLRARIVRVLHPSPRRRPSFCPFYATCGGCSLLHLEPLAQAEAKRHILRESLLRNGRLEWSSEIATHTGPELGYRTRARFHVRLSKGEPVVGLKARGTHRVVDVTRCLQLSPSSNGVLAEVRRWLAEKPARAFGLVGFEVEEPAHAFVLDTSLAGETWTQPGRIVVHFVVQGGRPQTKAELEDLMRRADLRGLVVSRQGGRARPRRLCLGQPTVVHRVGDFEYETGVGSFFQVNRYLLERLVTVVSSAKLLERATAVDLYCGVGLFTLPMARKTARVIGVESSSAAIADARANARRAGLDNVELVRSCAGDYAERMGLAGVDVVVADPPRGGLGRPVLDALRRHPPAELRYASCDPAAFGRDAGRLVSAGMVLERMVLLDLFPNTHHFETVGIFRRR